MKIYFRTLLLAASILALAGCGSETGTGKALDVGGPDATAVATLVEDLNDANTSAKKLDALFVKGAKPTDLRKFSKCSFYISSKPSVSGGSATCKVRIDDAAGKTLGEPEWSFEKDGDKWKVKAAPGAVSRPNAGWLVSPAFDLAFVANFGWLLLLVPGAATETDTVASFWQVYFLTLPHRWITLVLVALDPDRRAGRAPILAGTALVAIVLVVGVYSGTGGLTCLALVDFAWNAWHFGAQHSGILRMYSLKAGAGPSFVERWGLRLFVCYTLLRTAAWTTGWTIGDTALESGRAAADALALLLPFAVVLATVFNGRMTLGRMAYLASVVGLYAGLLGALMAGADQFVLPLMAASALFHAAEYLAVVSIYANRRRSLGSPGRFRALAKSWPTFLLLYVVALGSLGFVLEGAGPTWAELWLAVNVWAALVHYAFDGMIWRLRAPATARALGAEAAVKP